MGTELEYLTFQTKFGWVGLLTSAKGLCASTLPQPTPEAARVQLGSAAEQAAWAPARLTALSERLKAYFNDEPATFPDDLDLSDATPFQNAVWQQTRLIRYGETRSYQWVAEKIGKPRAARAVGQALGANPILIIVPCHRVVASDGKLGGFGAGLDMKKQLLRMEGKNLV